MEKKVHARLAALGARLRSSREEAGLSVTEAARRAGVSRRHWTETEAGRANPSVLVLARQADAVEVTLAELVELPVSGLRTERIALLGLRGAGKSTVGRLLARERETAFVELDRRVEELAGLSLAEIFDLHGPELFRDYEAEALEAVLSEGDRVVIATGGSIVARATAYERLLATCRTVWLRADPDEHFRRVVEQGDRRPMRDNPRAMEELRSILARREPDYARCDITIDTTDVAPEVVVRRVLEALEDDGGLDLSGVERLASAAGMELLRALRVGALVLATAACRAPEGGCDPRLGLAASVLPSAGLEAQGEVLWKRSAALDWRIEAAVAQQFLDDTDFVDDGNPSAGDWTQAGLSVRLVTAATERRHWTVRAGPIWLRARGAPNLVDEPGDYLGLRVGLGFETDLGPRWSLGPEIALIPAWGEGDFVVVPQLTWGVRWRP